MRFLMTLAAIGGLAAAAYAFVPTTKEEAGAELQTAALGTQNFLMHVNGRASSCKLSLAGGSERLAVGEGCGQYHGPIAAAQRWVEGEDGSIAITGADGRVLVEMAVSDGAGFESFSPPSPLILLVPVE